MKALLYVLLISVPVRTWRAWRNRRRPVMYVPTAWEAGSMPEKFTLPLDEENPLKEKAL